ncbi:MAG: cation:proton antiporter [Deltaproteobacteria bacterium]|jgi:cell volume regulation protein A|nr:cation:proton antiporter [Deltaproteobacteria bacterium]MBW2537186.1 cation:proton antiporter [Deltaproteobacteria bacterium]
MDPVAIFLLTIAAIFLIGVLGEIVFEKTGVPDVVWLITVGVLLGPVSGVVDRGSLSAVAPYFGAVTLVIVLFDGGSGLRLKELGGAASRSSLLAILCFVSSVVALAGVSMLLARWGVLPASWSWLHGIMLGAILGGSSSVVIMPALRKAGLAPRLSNVLNLESALTDVLCVVVAMAAVQIAVTGATDASAAAATLGKAFGIGLGVGAVAGLLALLALKKLKKSHHAYPLILGTLLLLYVAIEHLGGSPALGILAVAVIVGNAPVLSEAVGLAKSTGLSHGVTNTHGQITFIVKSFFFTFIGAMLGPPWTLVLVGVGLGLVLLLVRVPAVFLGTLGSGLPPGARGLVTVALPRGMAAGVLAMLPVQAGLAGTEGLPVVVFAGVITTIAIFAVGFPVFRRKLAAGAAPTAEPGAAEAAPAPTMADSTPVGGADDASGEAVSMDGTGDLSPPALEPARPPAEPTTAGDRSDAASGSSPPPEPA